MPGIPTNKEEWMLRQSTTIPTIKRLIDEGKIWYTPEEGLLGKAADGVIVSLGNVDLNTEAYLKDNPSPKMW